MRTVEREVVVQFRGLKFILPMQKENFWPYYGIYFVGQYDPIFKNIKSTDIVLDAGANIGFFTLLAARNSRKVIAVEPDPENFEYLTRNVKLNRIKNAILVNKALSDYTGGGYVSGRGPLKALQYAEPAVGAAVLAGVCFGERAVESPSPKGMSVKVTTIDSMLSSLDIKSIDVVKMDIEGEESRALKGVFLASVRELMVETHSDRTTEVIRHMLKNAGFIVKEWNFYPLLTLKNILRAVKDFTDTELKTRFSATALTLKYLLRLNRHPVPAAETYSGIRLLYASRLK